MILKIVFTVCLLIAIQIDGFSQFFSTGQDDSKIKWNEISTPNFRVIFPEDCSEIGAQMADKLEKSFAPVSAAMKKKPTKISVVIHGQSTISNGMVTWAPSKMEIFPFAPNENIAQPWLNHLAIHEYRHVVQFEYMNQGLTRFFTRILGESYQLIPIAIHLPYWVMEGDAVYSETYFSNAGRGRSPSFIQEFKALLLESKKTKYDKTMMGSLDEYMPSVYVSGYHVVLANTLNKDSAFCDNALQNLGKYWYYPFNKNLVKFRDNNKKRLVFKPAIVYLKEVWQHEDSLLTKTARRNLLPIAKNYADYSCLRISGDTVFAIKKSMENLSQLVAIDGSGNEHKIMVSTDFETSLIDAKNNKLLWIENWQHIRWEHKNGVDIAQYNIATGKTERICLDHRFSSVVYSPDGAQIAAISNSLNNRFNLKILNANTGAIEKYLIKDGANQMLHPAWSSDGKKLAFVSLETEGKSLRVVDLETNIEEILLPASTFNISNLQWHNRKIYFTGTWSGTNNIYSINTDTKACYQLTSERFGADFVTVKNDTTIFYAAYSSKGNKPVMSNASQWLMKPVEQIEIYTHLIDRAQTTHTVKPIDFGGISDSTFAIKPYNRLKNSLNFHSLLPWIPLRDDYNFQSVQVYSQNVLSNTFVTAGIDFDKTHYLEKYMVNFSYQRWFPHIEFEVSASDYGDFNSLSVVSVPFNWHFKSSYIWFSPFAMVGFGHETQIRTNRLVARLGVQFAQQRFMAAKDLAPKFGQTFLFDYTRSLPISASYNVGSLYYLNHRVNLPGLFKNNSFAIQNTFQKIIPYQTLDNQLYTLRSRISLLGTMQFLEAREIYKFGLSYRAPILYPDINIGSLFYCKRVVVEGYYDYYKLWNRFQNTMLHNQYEIVGGRITALSHLLRYDPEFELGFHAGWNFTSKKALNNFVFFFNMPF